MLKKSIKKTPGNKRAYLGINGHIREKALRLVRASRSYPKRQILPYFEKVLMKI